MTESQFESGASRASNASSETIIKSSFTVVSRTREESVEQIDIVSESRETKGNRKERRERKKKESRKKEERKDKSDKEKIEKK